MSFLRPHLVSALIAGAVLVGAGAGCGAARQPQLNVLSVEKAPSRGRDMVVYVEVVNHARRPMRLQRLQYTFAADGAATTHGELELGRRLVEAGSAVVVEVPLPLADAALGLPLTLAGKLWAEQDEILRTFAVAAEVAAPAQQLP